QDEGVFPFPIRAFSQEPEPFVLDDRDAAIAAGTTESERETLIVVVQVEQNIFLVSQSISAGADLNINREAILTIAQSVEATLPQVIPTASNTPLPVATLPPQTCPYIA